MAKYGITKPREWEAEAVDFFCVELPKISKAELLKYAQEACDFIAKTMHTMELRPRRSFIKRLLKTGGKHER